MKRFLLLLMGGLSLAALIAACSTSSSGRTSAYDNSETAEMPEPGTDGGDALIRWQARTNNAYVYTNGDGYAYLYLNLKSGSPRADQHRVPLNIALVLDRSGSMSGNKIAYARQAAKYVIDQLGKDDIVSIISYDDQVTVNSSAQPVARKESLKAIIDQITPGGYTNMTGGMLAGYAEVMQNRRSGYVNRVLLLTDGLANTGIVNPGQIRRLVQKKYEESGIALSTFGLGADYNEDLLTSLGETGRGNYYFIDRPDKISGIFARELKGLLQVVAQDAYASVALPEGIYCEKVYGYPYEIRNGNVQVRFNDIHADDEKTILIKLRVNRPVAAAYRFACTLSYIDARTFDEVRSVKYVQFRSTSDRRLVNNNEDPLVGEAITLFEANEEFDNIMKEVDNGNYEYAKARTDSVVSVIKDRNTRYQSPQLRKQQEQMGSYRQQMDAVPQMSTQEKSLYQKGNKQANFDRKRSQ